MSALRTIEVIAVLLTIMGMLWAGKAALDAAHVSHKEHIQLKRKELDRDITRNAQARYFYDNLASERDLSNAEQSRLKYIEEELERQYEEQAELRQAEDAL